MTESRDIAIEVLSQALGLSVSEIGDDTKLGVTPQWDSLAHMRLVLALEERLNRRLGPEQIVAIASLNDVVSAIEG